MLLLLILFYLQLLLVALRVGASVPALRLVLGVELWKLLGLELADADDPVLGKVWLWVDPLDRVEGSKWVSKWWSSLGLTERLMILW